MSSYADLDRPPLSLPALRRALEAPWSDVRLIESTPSTNAIAAAAAADGTSAGLVVVAEHQTAGRGRLGRTWEQPPRAGLAVSVLLRPAGTPASWGWLTLAAGLAVCGALDEVAGLRAEVKWPNDVLVGGAKLAGVLSEAVGGGLVIGIGLNCTTRADELPAGATSLALLEAETTDRALVLRVLLRALGGAVTLWESDRPSLMEAYAQRSATIGHDVEVRLPGGRSTRGRAEGVDQQGRLIVDGEPHASGDVIHLR